MSYLLGWPIDSLKEDMHNKNIRQEERRKVLEATSSKVLEVVWRQIWVQKCKSVKKTS
jgi:hypothetical protein